ncbi:MAG TPA: hypothetical protein VLJ38_13195 [Polyangiaceae bacterium]|nr:hypothetical protein [Polyangiaceae bacterium]
MYQPWMFSAMLAAGTGLVAFSVKLQHPSVPSLAPEPPAAAVHVVPPPAPTLVAEPADTNPVLQIPAIVIEGTRHRHAAPSEPAATEPAPAERPCSEWRDLGPTHVVSGQPSGNLAVRELCR